jgi:hypothetical protein
MRANPIEVLEPTLCGETGVIIGQGGRLDLLLRHPSQPCRTPETAVSALHVQNKTAGPNIHG